jgi:hypothetical protein
MNIFLQAVASGNSGVERSNGKPIDVGHSPTTESPSDSTLTSPEAIASATSSIRSEKQQAQQGCVFKSASTAR